jgi:molybdopterin synthase sulfur carrier subunit
LIKVLFFGPVAERMGKAIVTVEFRDGLTLQDLRNELALQFPQVFEIVCFAAVNGEHIRDMSITLTDNSEVAFMAKFSGG